MRRVRPVHVALLLVAAVVFAAPTGRCQEPEKVTVCELKDDPARFNHRLIEVSGFVSHGFEDFGLFDPSCDSYPYIWLEYGGVLKSGTMYCCGVTNERSRPKELAVEGISVPLVDDDQFREFDRLLQKPPDSVVHSRIVGRFFAGRLIRYPKQSQWGGYGHMGCCSLLAIQQVLSVDPQDRQDLDYRASPDQPDIEKTGCGYRDLVPQERQPLIQTQKAAERGQNEWVFDDPRRLAHEFLTQLLKIDENSILDVKEGSRTQGRIIYYWSSAGKQKTAYMIVVSRPYWLSFYATDPSRVAWAILAAYESSCGKHSFVKMIPPG